ncbi:hypothetical protein BD310DRAFT_262193 [Dichomitus squalens]|uniref:Uncharacterized protein n=1 Tax=Dichomitus squalens TaxID=114155 RepID=A0A4Q9PBZ2_9APHY|nr:hypothetical protein BD310DRAFT_262193 [Dichomitus squalens]
MRHPHDEPTSERSRSDRAGRRPSVIPNESMRRPVNDSPVNERGPSRQSRFGPPSTPVEPDAPRIWQTRDEALQMPRSNEDSILREPRDIADRLMRDDRSAWRSFSPSRDGLPRKRADHLEEQSGRSFAPPQPPSHPLPDVPPRQDRATTPPLATDRRDQESVLVDIPAVGKVHPDRARLLDGPEKEKTSKPVRIRRPAKSPDRGFQDRPPSVEDGRYGNLPAKPNDGRLGMNMLPPRDRSPPPAVAQNGYRPAIKRGTSLLERLNDPPPHDVASLRERVDISAADGGGPSIQHQTMDFDGDGARGGGDDASSRGPGGSGGGPGRRRPMKARRGGRRNGP